MWRGCRALATLECGPPATLLALLSARLLEVAPELSSQGLGDSAFALSKLKVEETLTARVYQDASWGVVKTKKNLNCRIIAQAMISFKFAPAVLKSSTPLFEQPLRAGGRSGSAALNPEP